MTTGPPARSISWRRRCGSAPNRRKFCTAQATDLLVRACFAPFGTVRRLAGRVSWHSQVMRIRTRARIRLILFVLLIGMPVVLHRTLIRQVGGAFHDAPEQLATELTPAARQLLHDALAPFEGQRLIDYHVHLVGLGQDGSAMFVNPRMLSWRHPLKHLAFRVYLSAAGIDDVAQADHQYRERMLRLMRGFPAGSRFMTMAFDKHHEPDGAVELDHTEFFVPNDRVFELAKQHPGMIEAVASVHPYRKDALAALQRVADAGARMIKWLPNAMGIDPADVRLDPYYRRMKALGLTLLSHAGEEKAVEAEEDQALGNPLRLRRALNHGVRVIVAHCASLVPPDHFFAAPFAILA
jgi:hypothetical protein